MNLNLLNLFAPPTQPQSSAGSALTGSSLGVPKSLGANIGDLMFGQLLTAQLQNAKVAAPLTAGANSGQIGQAAMQLQTVVTQLLQKGATLEQIANQLASSLGSNFLAQLQLQLGANPSQSLRSTLTQMLERALGPPANGPPDGTPAQVASVLVQRLVQVADTLAKAGTNAAGQQQDSLGTISDANAGDTPAPNTTAGILQAALAALQQSVGATTASASKSLGISGDAQTAQPNVGSQGPIPPPVPWVPTTISSQSGAPESASIGTGTSQLQSHADPKASSAATFQTIVQNTGGPTVATDPSLTLVGTGADTVIGRILARAANVAASQGQSSTVPANAQNATAILQPQLAVTPSGAATNGATGDALVASVLHSLQSALASLPPPKTDPSAPADSSTSPASTASGPLIPATFSNVGLGPAIATSVQNNAPLTTPTPPQSPSPPAVDPNAVVDQVLQSISMGTLSNGSQTVRMRLVPETLGSVTVNLQVQNGSVNATLLAQNTDVRDALLANQQMLTRSLADAGLRLASFTVNLANSGQYQQSQHQSQPRFGTTRRSVGITSSADDEAVSAVPSYGLPSTQLAALQWLNALA